MLDTIDFLRILHPAIAVMIVFPLIGIVLHMAWQTRQRRLQSAAGMKTKIPPVVGSEHVKIGKILAAAVVGISLLGLLHPSVKYLIKKDSINQNLFEVLAVAAMFLLTIGSLVLLYRAASKLWIGLFATLTGMGVVLIGMQDSVFGRTGFGAIFRRDHEWYVSHFYSGILATLLMIFSLAIIQDIYRDRSWRNAHTVINLVAVLLFVFQGLSGARDLLEIPLSWQEPFVFGCDFVNKTCNRPEPAKQSLLPDFASQLSYNSN